jgi:hypothetical protein
MSRRQDYLPGIKGLAAQNVNLVIYLAEGAVLLKVHLDVLLKVQ